MQKQPNKPRKKNKKREPPTIQKPTTRDEGQEEQPPALQEVKVAPECLQDGPRPQKQELEEVNLASKGMPPKPIFLAKDLPEEKKKAFIALIREYIDVFAWNYDEMPGLDPGVATHKLNVVLSAHPVKQGISMPPRSENRHPDAFATLASRVEVSRTPTKIEILKRSVPCSVAEIFLEEEIEDWKTPISNELKSSSAAVTLSNLKHFTIYQGVLYYRGSGGLLARCTGEEEAKVKIQEVHERSCRTEDASLYRRLQHQGYYWPTMATDAVELQSKCPKCIEIPSKAECNFIGVYSDWRKPYIDFLTDGPETSKALEVAHEVEHQGGAKLFQHLLHVGYYWPTMEEDAKNHVKRCKACQVHSNMIHAPAVDLRAIGTPWPFHTWGMDLIGPINPPSRGNIWTLTATELYTKWVEAVPLKRVTGVAVSNFIREHIICRFGIPKVILSDNGTPFVNRQVGQLLFSYDITHHKSTAYYPKGNGQAETTNKSLLKILSQTLEDHQKNWAHALPMALWAYRTSKRRPTQLTPFSLVYGAEAVLPPEIAIPSARVALRSEVFHDARPSELEALDERRDRAQANLRVYQQRIARAYDALVRPQQFAEGDLVLKATPHVMKGKSASKLVAKWEGPFVVKEANENGYYRLSEPDSNVLIAPINAKWLKAYHP
ncbi:hypothetical protein RHSIM_Rhsim01G0144000 [Rhododendron simsii]|uniref:Integrase catalytic domain-containing protein n=1 Tax=Rhododendron simsii TaxID=118357 RepID=A0A834LVV1_RHOSS|nr:hypothetical protein RHSIM_Rhsim01G0144000 [Rhododendron simsii]